MENNETEKEEIGAISKEKLEQLRTRFCHMNYFNFDTPGSSDDASSTPPAKTFAELVRDDIKIINKQDYKENENVKNWGEKLKYAQKMAHLTRKDTANLLGLSENAIVFEQNLTTHTVPITRLEAYSLIYHILPSSLLRLVPIPDTYQQAIYVPDDLSVGCFNYIMDSLYHVSCQEKIYALHAISIIGVLPEMPFVRFCELFKSSSMYKGNLKDDLDYYFDNDYTLDKCDQDLYTQYCNETNWKDRLDILCSLDYNQRDTWEYASTYAYVEASLVFDYLIFIQSPRLGLMAKLSSMGPTQLKKLVNLVNHKKYLKTRGLVVTPGFSDFLRVCTGFNGRVAYFTNLPEKAQAEPCCLMPKLSLVNILVKAAKNRGSES